MALHFPFSHNSLNNGVGINSTLGSEFVSSKNGPYDFELIHWNFRPKVTRVVISTRQNMYNIRGKEEMLKTFCIIHITTDVFIFSDLERKIIKK